MSEKAENNSARVMKNEKAEIRVSQNYRTTSPNTDIFSILPFILIAGASCLVWENTAKNCNLIKVNVFIVKIKTNKTQMKEATVLFTIAERHNTELEK